MNALTKIFAIACVGVALPNLDLFSINIALPSIAADFPGTALNDLSWVLNAYAIAYAALLVFFGRLAESSRRDLSFMLGIAIFTFAAAVSAAATNVWMLVALRVLTAAGAALMTPTSISLLLATHPPEKRGAAVRNWAGIGGLAAAIGPLLGGALVTIDWRMVFIVNAFIGGIGLILAWRYLPAVPGTPSRRPSFTAAMLITFGIGALTFAIVKGNAWGWQSPGIAVSIAASTVMLVLFIAHCAKSTNPLIDPHLFRIRQFTCASLAIFPYAMSFGAMLFSVAIWGQSAWGWSALEAGLTIIPGPLMVPITSTLVTGRLSERYGVSAPVSLGISFIALGLGIWAIWITLQPNTPLIMIGMLLNGIGVGLAFPALMGASTQCLPASSFATGSAMINMLRQAAIAIGVAIFVAIVGSPTTPSERLAGFQLGWSVMAVITVTALIPTFMALHRDPK